MGKDNLKDNFKILIVENNAVFRKGLEQLLNHEKDITVHGFAEDASNALALITESKPDLVIADITLDGRNGIELIKDISREHPPLPILVLSMHEESLYAKLAINAGARGYITKQEAPEQIVQVVRKLLKGETYTSKGLTRQLGEARNY